MSALDWGAGTGTNATPRYYTLATPALGASDFAIFCWVRRNATEGSNDQRLWGIGNGDTTDSLYQYIGENGGGGRPVGSDVINSSAVTWYNGAPALGAVKTDGLAYLCGVQLRSGTFETYCIRNGLSATRNDFATGVSGTFSAQAAARIGSDPGGTSGYLRNPLGDWVLFDNRSFSLAELTTLASGAPVTAIATPLIWLRFRSGAVATEVNQGSGGATYNATMVSSGFTTVPDFFIDPYVDAKATVPTYRLDARSGLYLQDDRITNADMVDVRAWW